ncbi:MAG: DUF2318 domain-containing protein [Acidobacteria bacterium]|nr:DUF2318 domain-containing protein [Acidobacteriota bacterium]
MTESFFETIRYGIAVVLLVILPAARGRGGERPRHPWSPFAGGIAGGVALAVLYVLRDVRTPVEPLVMLATALFLAAQLVPFSLAGARPLETAWRLAAFLLTAQRSAALLAFVVSRSQDRVDVLNSEFLLFHGGIILGVALLATAGATLSRLSAQSGAPAGRAVAVAATALLVSEHVSWGYYALVLHGWVSLPESLFTTVSSVINRIRWFGYGQMGLATVFGIWCHVHREKPRRERADNLSPAGRRKYLWGIRRQWRYGVTFLGVASAAMVGTLYYKLYASQPPRLSPAERVEARQGRLVIPVEGFKPEEFHRYAYSDEKNQEIRFIVFKDESGRVRAAYDACLMCGDEGYLKRGKELICLACGAAIYAPTVGREGGCNPIPLVYAISEGELVVTVDTLLHGDGADAFRHGDGNHR